MERQRLAKTRFALLQNSKVKARKKKDLRGKEGSGEISELDVTPQGIPLEFDLGERFRPKLLQKGFA